MEIYGAEIKLGGETPNKPFSSYLMLENTNDKVVSSIIQGGAIVPRTPCFFINCNMDRTNLPNNLGRKPPSPCPIIKDCILEGTKLPEGYYFQCYFGEHEGKVHYYGMPEA